MKFKIIISVFSILVIVNIFLYSADAGNSGTSQFLNMQKNGNVISQSEDSMLSNSSNTINQPTFGISGRSSGGVGGFTDPSSRQNKSVYEFVDNYWFSLTTGIASILGLLFALYPVQIRNLPPSVFRSLIWKKSLLTSFGVGVIVFSGIQFYNQYPPPGGLFGIPYSIIHASESIVPYFEGGTYLWGVLFFFGLILLWKGTRTDPMGIVRERLINDGQEIRHLLEKELKTILSNKSSYEDLSLENKYLYKQTLKYYEMIQLRIVELMAGTSINATKYETNLLSLSTTQVEDLLMQINNDMKAHKEYLNSDVATAIKK